MSEWGSNVERYTRHMSGVLGVPDFVYIPVIEGKGTATRELSDGLLAVGADGLIIQVKSRDPGKAPQDDPSKAERWVRKAVKKALRQARGTRRRMIAGATEFVSMRGYAREFAPGTDWLAVIVVAHANLPSGISLSAEDDALVIALGDWLALHERLRSTAAVIDYVRRALALSASPDLEAEEERYMLLASADAVAPGGANSVPLLPLRSLEGQSELDALFVKDLIEKVWPEDGELPWKDPDEYRRIVEALDRLPPLIKVEVGRKLRETFLDMSSARGRRSFLVFDSSQSGVFAFVFDVADNWDDAFAFAAEVGAVACVRHVHAIEAELNARFTLGVGVLDHDKKGRQYWFVLAEGDPLDVAAVRGDIEFRYGIFDGSSIVAVPEPGRNEPCPCGSGSKFKKCHGASAR